MLSFALSAFIIVNRFTGNRYLALLVSILMIVLEKNLIPYSITTINDSGKGTLLVGTTSGQIIEVTLP